jgi:hypothetical protein
MEILEEGNDGIAGKRVSGKKGGSKKRKPAESEFPSLAGFFILTLTFYY